MVDRFTADDAFDADDCGEPIVLGIRAAARLCRQHDAALVDYVTDTRDHGYSFNAAELLGWLGY